MGKVNYTKKQIIVKLQEVPQRLTSVQAHLENLYQQTQNAKVESKKPPPFESDLEQKSTRHALLDAELNMEDRKDEKDTEQTVMDSYVAKRENQSATRKPSIPASLKAAATGIAPPSDSAKTKDIQM